MHQRSMISLSKLIFRHPFQSSSIPRFLFPSKFIASFSNQPCLNPFSPQNPKKNHNFFQTTSLRSSSSIRAANIFQNLRLYSVDTDKEIDKINFKFAEAREEIESAMESKETVYFDEEAECARAVVNEVLDLYDGLLGKLPENEKRAIQRSMGLKIEQLKAELQQLNE